MKNVKDVMWEGCFDHVQFISTTDLLDIPDDRCIVMVDGTVPGWRMKRGDFHYDHHHPDGDEIQLTEIPAEHVIEIQRRAVSEPLCFVTTLADADAAAAAAYCLTGASGEDKRRLSAIAYDCDHLTVPDSLEDLSGFAFNAVATFKRVGAELSKTMDLHPNRKRWTAADRLQFCSTLFESATKHYVDAIRGKKPWPGERGEAQGYRQSIAQMANRLQCENRLYSKRNIPVVDCTGINAYVDPRAALLAWKQARLLGERVETLTIHDHKLGGVSYTVGCVPLHPLARQLNYSQSLYERLTKMERQKANSHAQWGGRRTVGGSPWNSGSMLSVEQIIDALESGDSLDVSDCFK